jgi:hypothetical protein
MKPLLKCALLVLPLAAACNGSSTVSPSNSAELRVINASPDAGPLDVYLQTTLAVDSLPYSLANPYVFVQSGAVDVAVRAHAAINVLLESSSAFNVGAFYTYIVTGTSASLSSVLLTDDTTAAPAGSFKLRMVHLAPAGPAMDLYYTGPTNDLTAATPIVTALAFKSATAYLTPAIGSGRLRVTQTGTKTVLIDSGTLTFSNGQVSTLFVLGSPTNGGGSPYSGQFLNP